MPNLSKIILPTLRGKMGDWFYYVTVLKFSDVAERVLICQEIDTNTTDEDKSFCNLAYCELDQNLIQQLVEYLHTQEQRFFNSLILGIYGGSPHWQEIEMSNPNIDEDTLRYLSSTMGVLTLQGDEHIFAIDGQHRAVSIREAVKNNPELKDEEVTAIFLAHKTTPEGRTRTWQLTSTLKT